MPPDKVSMRHLPSMVCSGGLMRLHRPTSISENLQITERPSAPSGTPEGRAKRELAPPQAETEGARGIF